jgi:hypothetical protein
MSFCQQHGRRDITAVLFYLPPIVHFGNTAFIQLNCREYFLMNYYDSYTQYSKQL